MTKQQYVAIICRLMDALAHGEIDRHNFKRGMHRAIVIYGRSNKEVESCAGQL